jgi:hypothetical protein
MPLVSFWSHQPGSPLLARTQAPWFGGTKLHTCPQLQSESTPQFCWASAPPAESSAATSVNAAMETRTFIGTPRGG